MPKSKLWSLLESVPSNLFKDLQAFAKMPSSNLSPRDQQILGQLLTQFKKKKQVEEDDLWARIIQAEEEHNFNKIKSRLLGMLESYLAWKGIEADPLLKQVMLAKYGAENDLSKYARARLKKGIKDFEKYPSPTNSLALFRLYEIYINYEKDVKNRDNKVEHLHHSLEDFHSWHKIRLLCEIVSRSTMLDRESQLQQHRPEIERYAAASASVHVQAYYHLFELMATGDAAYLERLQPYLQKEIHFLDHEYQKEIYTHILNFYIRQFNVGQADYAQKYIRCVEFLEEKDMLLDHDKIGLNRLHNYIATCIAESEFVKAERFLQKYKNRMEDTPGFDKTAFVPLFTAILEMYDGRVQNAFTHLIKFKNSVAYRKDVYQRINCDKTFIKAEVMAGDEEQARYKTDRLKEFLRAKKKHLPPERMEINLLFLKLLIGILDGKEVDVTAYRHQLASIDFLWLLGLTQKSRGVLANSSAEN